MAIQGQCAQLLQVALLPAVGASIRVLPGANWRMRCRMPWSVATMYCWAWPSTTALIMPLVEPTTSANSMTEAGDSGCTNTMAWGCFALRAESSAALNSS